MIEEALFERRVEITELLDIDPNDCEAVRVPQESVNPAGSSFDAYMAQRNSCAEVRWTPLIDLVLADVRDILARFVVDLINLNKRPRYPEVHRTLVVIASRVKFSEQDIEGLTLRVQRRLRADYVGGSEEFCKGRVRSEAVIETARLLLEKLPTPKRGRPKASTNRAAEKMIRDLVSLYAGLSSGRPARTVVIMAVGESNTRHVESGNTLDFLKCVLSGLPDEHREQVTRSGGGLASLLQRALSPPSLAQARRP